MKLFEGANPKSGFPALERIRHQPVREALRQIQHSLQSTSIDSHTIAEWLGALKQSDVHALVAHSVERASHFKWFLGESKSGYVVWLHEYKSAKLPDAAGSFAASVHNHRYSFASKILNGSLLVSTFRAASPSAFPVFDGTQKFEAPDTYALTADRVHRIDATEQSTCTLVVQCPPEKSYSRVYDLTNRSYQDMYDLPSKLPQTIALLTAAETSGHMEHRIR
jgi:hypothetical protein